MFYFDIYAFEDCINLESIVIRYERFVINNNAFKGCDKISIVYYEGSKEQFEDYANTSNNMRFFIEILHFYSETEPPLNEDGTAYDGQYWRYVDGVPTAWVK